MRTIVPLALAGLAAATAAAQTERTVTNRLPEIVVTATRTPEEADKTATTITVITREHIESGKLHSLSQALESVPGLTVVQSGTPGQITSVFSRGTESNHTLLVVDGRRMSPALAGGFFYENLTLDNVERIEVVRSPSSVLYGSDAIGGVVNVITKSGRGLAKPEHEISFEGGSFNTFRESASSRGAFGKFDYSVGASQFNAEYPRDNNDFRLSSIRGSMGYEVTDDIYVDVKGSYFYSDGGSPGTIVFPDPFASLQREVSGISPGLTWDITEKITSKLFYSYEHQFQRFRNQFGTDNKLRMGSHQADWQNDFEVCENWKLTGGIAFQDLNISQVNAAGIENIHANQTGVGGYIQSRWSPHERVNLINSIRYDTYTDYPSAVSWRNGLSWRIPKTETLVYGNVSRSYSPPSPQDLYFPGFNNPNLLAEDAFSWEAGIEQPFLDEKLKFSAVWFQNKIDNLIQFSFATFTPQNIAKATAEGVELSLSYQPCAAVETSLSYTYLTALDDVNSIRLLRRPRHQINWNTTVRPCKNLVLSSGLLWVVEREDTSATTFLQGDIEDYLTVRAAASYEVCKNFQVWIRGENITDQRYEPVSGFPALRLGVYGGARVSF